MEDRWRCGGSSGSSERDRLRVTERNPAPLPRPVQAALEPSERLFDGHLRNCARFQGSTSERRNVGTPSRNWRGLGSGVPPPSRGWRPTWRVLTSALHGCQRTRRRCQGHQHLTRLVMVIPISRDHGGAALATW